MRRISNAVAAPLGQRRRLGEVMVVNRQRDQKAEC
jgi:hypothetical protein